MSYVLITGATDGIGLKTAEELVKRGEALIIHGRNPLKLDRARERLKELNPTAKVKTVLSDFSNLEKTKEAFSKIKGEDIKVLINNAGCFDAKGIITKDGFGLTYQVNHLAHFLITHILLDSIIKNAPSKIIIVASMAHASYVDFEALRDRRFSYGYEAYACSKLCNILFTFKLARMLEGKNISVNCLHPGVINTKLLVDNWGACGIDVSRAHEMVIYAYNLSSEITGCYLKDFKISKAADFAYSLENQDKCYKISFEQVKRYLT